MKRIISTLSAITTLVLLCSCGSTNTIMVGQPRPATAPGAVRVYYTPPRHFERIAIINASSGPRWGFTSRGQVEDAIEDLREEAAKVGANGVLIEAVGTRSSGSLGI